MKELDDLIKHIGRIIATPEMQRSVTKQLYIAYVAALNTPPACLPEPPEGKMYERVEYGSWQDTRASEGEIMCRQDTEHED